MTGDLMPLQAGDRISADAEALTANRLALDESMLTGESVPVHPEAGRAVHAGTFVIEGEAEALVTATGGDIRPAGSSRSPGRRTAGPVRSRSSCTVGVLAVAVLAVAVGVTVALVPEGLLPGHARTGQGGVGDGTS